MCQIFLTHVLFVLSFQPSYYIRFRQTRDIPSKSTSLNLDVFCWFYIYLTFTCYFFLNLTDIVLISAVDDKYEKQTDFKTFSIIFFNSLIAGNWNIVKIIDLFYNPNIIFFHNSSKNVKSKMAANLMDFRFHHAEIALIYVLRFFYCCYCEN